MTHAEYKQFLQTETFREKHATHIVAALLALAAGVVVWSSITGAFASIAGAL